MAHVSNVIRFPVIPRKTPEVRLEPQIEASNNQFMMRMFLKDIIDTAYDGLLNHGETEALNSIQALFQGQNRTAI